MALFLSIFSLQEGKTGILKKVNLNIFLVYFCIYFVYLFYSYFLQIPFPTLTEDMYLMGIEDSYNKCLNFTSKMEQVFNAYKARRDWVMKQSKKAKTLCYLLKPLRE